MKCFSVFVMLMMCLTLCLTISTIGAAETPRAVSAETAKLLNIIAKAEPQAAMDAINAYEGNGHPLLTLATAQTQWRLSLVTTDAKASAVLRNAAEVTFKDALTADATLRQAHLGLAQCAAAKNDWLTASREAALGVDATYGNQQEIIFLAQTALNAQDWRMASIAAQQGILRFPDEPVLRRIELSVLLHAMRYEEARQAVLALLDESPNDVDLWKQLAFAAQRTKRQDEAVAALESAVLIKPDDRSNRRALGDMQLALKMPQAALTTLRPLIGEPPSAEALTDSNLMFAACRAAADAGDITLSRQWLAAVKPPHLTRDISILSARLALQAGDEKAAADALDTLISSGEKDPSILAWAGSLAQRRGDAPTAELLYLTAAAGETPAAAAASLRLVALYIEQKRLEDARVSLALHINKYPTDLQAKALLKQIERD